MGSFSSLTTGTGGGASYPPVISHTVVTYRGGSTNGQTGVVELDVTSGYFNPVTDRPYKLIITNPNNFGLYLFFLNGSEAYVDRSQYSYDVVVPPNTTGDVEVGGERVAIAIGFGGGNTTTSPIAYSVLSKRYEQLAGT